MLVLLAACAPKRGTQSLADFGGQILLEVPLPTEADAFGGAFFDARMEGLDPGKDVSTPADGVVLTCKASGSGHLSVRVMIDGTQVASRSGVIQTTCPVAAPPIPVLIRW